MCEGILHACTRAAALLLLASARQLAFAQGDLQPLLDRLDRLEAQNNDLMREIRALRAEIKASEASRPEVPVEERLAVQERRVEEHAQTKIESGSKLPVRFSGTVLFNAFLNSRFSGAASNPTVASQDEGPRSSGATVRQTIWNLEFDGGQPIGGGKLSGSLSMDFFGGSSGSLNHLLRIRTGEVRLKWNRTSLVAGQDKPIFSPRDPTSLAQVGVSPLTGAGNPWLWLPQFRVEQDFSFGEETGVRAQIGVLQTNELSANVPGEFTPSLERSRPALQGRFEFTHRQLQLAPGFHFSRTHVAGSSVPSSAVSVDWSYSPWAKLRFTGLLFAGANIANLGTLRQGFTIISPGNVIAIRSRGGWGQLAFTPTSRLSLHVMAGQQDDNNSDLRFGGIGKNQAYAANIMYRIGPSVIVALESAQVRTSYLLGPDRRNTHYDLAVAYLF